MIYVFCGDDYLTIKSKYELLLSAQHLTPVTFSSVKDMCTTLYQKSLITQNNALCVRYDNDFLKAESAWQSVLDASKDKTVILIYADLDKRSKFYKFFLNFINDFRVDEDNPVFGFSRCVCKRHIKEALNYADMIDGKDAIYALNLLYSRLRKILQIQATPKSVKLSVNTGLSDKEAYLNKDFINKYDDDDIAFLMIMADYCIEKVKTGEISSDSILLYYIIQIT